MSSTVRFPVDAVPEPLQAIRDKLTALRAQVEPLEQAEALLAPIYEPGEAEKARKAGRRPAEERRAKRRRRKGAGGRNPRREEILDYILAHGPVARKVLLAALGGHPKTMSNNLKRLLEDGKIEADLAPGGRLYRAPSSIEDSPSAALSTFPPPPKIYPVLDAIGTMGKATTEQLMARTGLAKPVVVAESQQLKRLGLLELAEGADGKPVWVLTADLDRRVA
jgi:DNA-binding transcriptional ArsR family regulator